MGDFKPRYIHPYIQSMTKPELTDHFGHFLKVVVVNVFTKTAIFTYEIEME